MAKRDRDTERMRSSQMPATITVGPGQIQKLRTRSRFPLWVVGTQALEP